jgi:hypothetical protein
MQIEDYPDVKRRVGELDCAMPSSLALLPRNFADAKSKDSLVHEETASTIRLLWKQAEIVETPIEKPGEKVPEIIEKSFDWIGPTIFVASSLLSQNPMMIDVAVGVISDYLCEMFKGFPSWQRKATLNVVVQRKSGSYKKVHYEGPIEGLKEVPKIVRSLHDEE